MKKVALSLLLTLLIATPVYAASFSDVSGSDSDYEAVSDIVARGIAMGYGDGTFGPNRSVTRAEATKFIARTVGLDCSAYASTEPDFTDTASSYGLKEYIACFKAKGFASGYGDGRFGPQNEVLGPEFLKMLYGSVGANFQILGSAFYADLNDVSLIPYVQKAIIDGIRPPADAQNKIGNTALLRRDVARYLYNFINFLESRTGLPWTYDVPVGNRVLLVLNENGSYCSGYENCTEVSRGINRDLPTTTVNYRSEEKGISIELPYNPNWGSINYSVTPYDQLSNKVYFGPLYGLVWREQALSFEDAIAAAEVMQKYSIVNMVSPYVDVINDTEVVKFADSGMVSEAYLMVIGNNYNYLFRSSFSSGSAEDKFEELGNIVETMEFI